MQSTFKHKRGGGPLPGNSSGSPSSARRVRIEPWSETRVVKTMWPPQPGTRRLHDEHGARLVCVRYRHDHGGNYRYTTVELMVDHAPVRHRDDHSTWVQVRVPAHDADVRAKVKAAGGKWQQDTATWLITRKVAIRLGLWAKMRPAKPPAANRRGK
jgi:hypothetical protein